jgi:lipoprotein NlpI
LYRHALDLDPANPGALTNLGNLLWDQNRPAEAILHYQHALSLRPDSAEASLNLGVALSDIGRLDEAAESIKKAINLRPNWPHAINNLGMNLARQGRWNDAIVCYNQALTHQPELAEAQRNRGFAKLALGDYAGGWIDHEARLRCRNYRGLKPNLPLWDGSDLHGRTILLHSEQGLGDCLQFMRFAAPVKEKGAIVLLACAEPLARLLALCPFIDRVVRESDPMPPCDLHAPIMSLPAILNTTADALPRDVPYVQTDAASRTKWSALADRALAKHQHKIGARAEHEQHCIRVGVAWRGNPQNRVDRERSFPVQLFGDVAKIPQIQLFRLQFGNVAEELAQSGLAFPMLEVEDHTSGASSARDFLDTAAIINSLDLVICPDTAVAHLAGAMGAKVWLALPYQSEWRWAIAGDFTPWYPSMRIFRQTSPGDWPGVFERMALELAAWGATHE